MNLKKLTTQELSNHLDKTFESFVQLCLRLPNTDKKVRRSGVYICNVMKELKSRPDYTPDSDSTD